MNLNRVRWTSGCAQIRNGHWLTFIWSRGLGEVDGRDVIRMIEIREDDVYGASDSSGYIFISAHPFYMVRGDRETET